MWKPWRGSDRNTNTFAENISGTNSEDTFAEILDFVKKIRGIDFSAYRVITIGRRLMGRLHATGMPDYKSYAGLLSMVRFIAEKGASRWMNLRGSGIVKKAAAGGASRA